MAFQPGNVTLTTGTIRQEEESVSDLPVNMTYVTMLLLYSGLVEESGRSLYEDIQHTLHNKED